MTKPTTSPEDSPQVLYRHVKRPRWGLAMLAWDDNHDKRGYQFEDGKLRIFKRGFYRLLEEVDPPADRAQRVLERLGRATERLEAVKNSKSNVLIPIAEQIAYFKEQYPDGFAGDSWTAKMRGRGAKKALKRHRDPVVKRARKLLAQKRLERLIEARQYDEVIEALVDVLGRTSLVTAGKLEPLRRAFGRQREAIAVALQRLLHGDGPLDSRFDDFVRSTGEPSWELATAPMALVHPEEHVCVKPSVFNQQALWMAPRLERTPHPTAQAYHRYRRMALAVSDLLVAAGVEPLDLLDLHDFIYVTLRPAARKLLAARGRDRVARAAAARRPVSSVQGTDREAA